MTTLDCNDDILKALKDGIAAVRRLACKDLTLARNEIRLIGALRALRDRAQTMDIDAEQARWTLVGNACEKRGYRLVAQPERLF